MSSAMVQPGVWALVTGTPSIDPSALLAAVEREAGEAAHDFRTKLLLRDALAALARRLGEEALEARLSGAARGLRDRLEAEGLGEAGFPSLERRMADATRAETILQFLRELGSRVHTPTRMDVGGSSSLILAGLLSRATDDIDAVDEVPAVIRNDHPLLDELIQRYGLRLAHFQSHFLPTGWEQRVRSLGRFAKLDVFLVDPVDIFVGKLFSKRTKDLDDLRMLRGSLDRSVVENRLRTAAGSLLSDAERRAEAERSWYVVFGEALPA